MAKLYFRYGAMRSAKTLNLLAVAHNYKDQHKIYLTMKPAIDTRVESKKIWSRAGLEASADVIIHHDIEVKWKALKGVDCILVDEAQFLSSQAVDQLRRITSELNVPVICYGLRTDFRGRLFEGSRRLLELADTIEEIKVTCQFCNRKAILNMRLFNGEPTLEGNQIQVGDEDYVPTCYKCYAERLGHPPSD
jgi:thymidine kinase